MDNLMRVFLFCLSAFVLTACGSNEEVQTTEASDASPEVKEIVAETPTQIPKQAEPENKEIALLPAVSKAFGYDLLGVRLGMSSAEIHNTLEKQFGSDIEYKTSTTSVDYYRPELGSRALNETARIESASQSFTINYTYPPDDLAALKVTRTTGFPNGEEPVVETLLSSLKDKYGGSYIETTSSTAGFLADRRTGTPRSWAWSLNPDKPNCAMNRGKPTYTGAPDWYGRGGGGLVGDVNRDNASACSDLLGVTMGVFAGDIVGYVTFELVDYDKAINSYKEHQAWIEKREAEVLAERQKAASQNAAPTL